MRIKIFLFSSLILLIFTDFSFANGRTYQCLSIAEEPNLDGKVLEDPFWEKIPAGEGFYLLGGEEITCKDTLFKAGYFPDKALYFGIICKEPELDKIKAEKKDGQDLWYEDSVEIFIYPAKGTYLQFIANSKGARFNNIDKRGNLPLWNWKVKTYRGEDFYSLEFEIPFEVLGKSPETNEAWTFNICRNDYTSMYGQLSSWSKMERTFHEPDNFSTLVFSKVTIKTGKDIIK